MASIIAHLPSPTLLLHNRTTMFSLLQKLPVSPIKERRNQGAVVAVKAVGDSSESSSSSLDIVKSIQDLWDDSEDRLALIGLGFAAVLAIWTSTSLVAAVDKLPIFAGVFELIGILYTSWFIYRYLLFKPNREELSDIINNTYSEILGK